MRLPLVLGAAVLSAATLTAQAQTPSADDLAGRLQKRYETIRDFTASFVQTYKGLLIRTPTTERGTVQVKKPNRIRFTYERPERKIFVSDGSQFYSYFPAERAGTVAPLPPEDRAPTALLFLAGRGNLVRDFTASLPADQPAGEWQLQLTPKSTPADFETLTLFVDRQTLALRGFTTVDEQGTNTIRFSQLRENVGLRDTAFNFSFPRGTEIIR